MRDTQEPDLSAPVRTCPPNVRQLRTHRDQTFPHLSAPVRTCLQNVRPRNDNQQTELSVSVRTCPHLSASVSQMFANYERHPGTDLSADLHSCPSNVFWIRVWFLDVSLSWRKFGGQVRRGADRCRQVCFLGVFLSWPTFGGDLRTVADSYGQVWFLGFLSCRTFGGQVRGQVRTGVDRCGKVMFLGVT